MIKVQHIHKTFGKEEVIRGLSFDLAARKTLSILGPSGCGKSTLLKVMAGLEQADSGTFTVEGRDMFQLTPQERGVVYLSQEALLFPHMNVRQNLGYGLQIRRQPKARIKEKVDELADRLGLLDQMDKMPQQVSGGQRQRVSFGRALIINPRILLLDEPFGSLDADTRSDMQRFFQQIRDSYQITALFVTHDLKEALTMGHQIGRMQRGALQVYASIEAFLQSPEAGAAEELHFWERITNIYHARKERF